MDYFLHLISLMTYERDFLFRQMCKYQINQLQLKFLPEMIWGTVNEVIVTLMIASIFTVNLQVQSQMVFLILQKNALLSEASQAAVYLYSFFFIDILVFEEPLTAAQHPYTYEVLQILENVNNSFICRIISSSYLILLNR